MNEFDFPRVGCAVFIYNDENKILLGLRKSKLGEMTWSIPGGHLEKFETPEQCVIRETKEETDLDIDNIRSCGYTNDLHFELNKHYITLFFETNYYEGELSLTEPDKFEKWDWFDVDNLPDNLFEPVKNYFEGKIYN